MNVRIQENKTLKTFMSKSGHNRVSEYQITTINIITTLRESVKRMLVCMFV
jgi:hypothetical protein